MFCPFCGDQVAGECPKPACRERLSAATLTLAVASPPVAPPAPNGTAVAAPPPAPVALAPPPPPRATGASVEQVMTARGNLWSDLDSTAALVTKIEGAASGVAGAPASGVAAHPRLTAGADLIAELWAIQNAVAAETQQITAFEGTIGANRAEIARLKRNRRLTIAAIVVGVLLVLILIATAL